MPPRYPDLTIPWRPVSNPSLRHLPPRNRRAEAAAVLAPMADAVPEQARSGSAASSADARTEPNDILHAGDLERSRLSCLVSHLDHLLGLYRTISSARCQVVVFPRRRRSLISQRHAQLPCTRSPMITKRRHQCCNRSACFTHLRHFTGYLPNNGRLHLNAFDARACHAPTTLH